MTVNKAIILLSILIVFTSCGSPDNSLSKTVDTTAIVSENIVAEITKDTVTIWGYDYLEEIPIRLREVNPDTLTAIKLIQFINHNRGQGKIVLNFKGISNDTIYLKIKDSSFLTQQMGTPGADDYVSTTVYTLTDLKGVKYVNFDFEVGDHASPGTYSRQYYIDRRESNRK